MPGLDLFTLTSLYGEGFPNVVGEAMACGVPSVVTDVGDSGHLVADTGEVVPPGDVAKLAEAWLRMVRLPTQERMQLGERARQRITEHFSLAAIVSQYEELYANVVRPQGRS
jgi:glycosyltransferase involved in cell wall biosynthesis